MKKLLLLLGIVCIATMMACTPTKQSTIDEALQTKVDSVLQNKMGEINAVSGQAIVMEVQTGEIKAMVGDGISQESGLTRTASLLAALETGRVKLSDTVDVGEGVYMVHGKPLSDHNWRMGGFGKITTLEGLMLNSYIALYKNIERAFEEENTYFGMLNKMCYGQPECIEGLDSLKASYFETPEDSSALAWSCIGHNQRIAPIQMLTFYNAIANGGKMVKPMLYKGETEVLNPQIASKANIDSLQMALVHVVTEGLGKPAQSGTVQVAGFGGGFPISTEEDNSEGRINTVFSVGFCGYFPADNPKYSIIVCMNKKGYPANSYLMAGSVFKEIVDYMVDSGETTETNDTTSLTDSLPKKSLNDIRFAGWTEKDWLDNEYIKTLRNHIDACLQGKISDSQFEKYKDELSGKFMIGSIEPYIMGGVFIQFCFIDRPNKIFSTWVYSKVDEETETVYDYECNGLEMEEYESDLTKEEMIRISEEHPEQKIW